MYMTAQMQSDNVFLLFCSTQVRGMATLKESKYK